MTNNLDTLTREVLEARLRAWAAAIKPQLRIIYDEAGNRWIGIPRDQTKGMDE